MSNQPDLNQIAQPTIEPVNRGYENKFDISDNSPKNLEVTLIKIDETIVNYLINVVKPTVVDNDRIIPVPVIYTSPERWKNIKKDGYLRDQKNDKMQTPLITIRRRGISKNSLTNPSNKYLHTTHQGMWNSRIAYDRFAVQNNIKPSIKSYNVIIPDYIDISYEIILWTEYQEQLNSLIEQINVENDEFWGSKNEFKFRVNIQEYSGEDDLPATEERIIRNSFNMSVFAYLLPERMIKNFQLSSTIQKDFSAKKLVEFIEVDNTI